MRRSVTAVNSTLPTPCCHHAANSARIGGGLSTYHDGLISPARASAKAAGFEVEMPAKKRPNNSCGFRR
jgi:hypothetical protein